MRTSNTRSNGEVSARKNNRVSSANEQLLRDAIRWKRVEEEEGEGKEERKEEEVVVVVVEVGETKHVDVGRIEKGIPGEKNERNE